LLYILIKIKSEKSTFVFKSPDNKNNADKNYYQLNKYNSKNSACLQINFIKICPEIAIKYFFEKMWFYMKYIVKNRRWRILMSMDMQSAICCLSCDTKACEVHSIQFCVMKFDSYLRQVRGFLQILLFHPLIYCIQWYYWNIFYHSWCKSKFWEKRCSWKLLYALMMVK
jgi:hypothetical protein